VRGGKSEAGWETRPTGFGKDDAAMTHKGDRQVAPTILGHKNLCPYKDRSSRRGREDLSANHHCPRFSYAADFDY
jgi:hypothetical protein